MITHGFYTSLKRGRRDTIHKVSVLLCFLFFSLYIQVYGSCDDNGPYSGGDGSSTSPYQLSTTTDISALATVSHTDIDDCFYELTSNIVFISGSAALNPIGGSGTANSAARISFNGNHYSIKGVTVNNNGNNVGFFGKLENSTVQNLVLDSITVQSNGTVDIGGLAGEISGSTIDSVVISGRILHSQSSGSASYVGGLAGFTQSNSSITQGSFTGSVIGDNVFSGSSSGGLIGHAKSTAVNQSFVILDSLEGGKNVGGLIGYSSSGLTLTQSYSKGVISLNRSSDYVGGLVGEVSAYLATIIIRDSYSRVRIFRNGFCCGSSDYSTGGIGYVDSFADTGDSVKTSYASVRGVNYGFTGNDRKGVWTNNFYDSDSSNKSDNEGASPLTTLELQNQTNLSGWNFDDIWAISESYNDGFPYLQWEPGATPPTPDQATLSSPADGATGQSISPTLEWGAAARATSYTVQVSTDGFTTTVVNESTSATSLAVSGLAYSTTYQWRVRASNDAGDASWSATRTFTTGAPDIPEAPSLSSPADEADSLAATPTLQWAASTDATSYEVQVSTDGFSTTVVSTTTSSTSLQPSLDWSTTYEWRVRASNQSGTSGWSTSRTFTTRQVPAPGAPSLSFPADGATGLAADSVLAWSAATYATGYELEVSTLPTFATTTYSTPQPRQLRDSNAWMVDYILLAGACYQWQWRIGLEYGSIVFHASDSTAWFANGNRREWWPH